MKIFAITSAYAWIDDTWLPDACLTIRDGLITDISTSKPSGIPLLDASNDLLLPGFVNAHCHLELTALGPLSEHAYLPWIAALMAKKKTLSSQAMALGIKTGAQALLQSGVTTVIDHVSQDTNPKTFTNLPINHIGFGEVLGVNSEMAQASLNYWEQQNQLTLSPHSIHALAPDVLRQIFLKRQHPFSIHLAESESERAYFSDQAGPLWNFIQSRGGKSHDSVSAVAWLQSQGYSSPASLLVHGNYFSDDDLALIAQWPKACLVHCPGSHAFFEHQDFPFEKVKLKNISVALGTDSLASNTALSLGHEIKLFCQKYPGQTLQTIMPLITTNALRAIGITDRGQLAIGQKADLSFWKKIDPEKALEAITRQQKPASVMINGVTVQE